jgi:hypothetical protein
MEGLLAGPPADPGPGVPADDPRHRRARFQLLAAQTSRYRSWGEGIWTNHGTELAHGTTQLDV